MSSKVVYAMLTFLVSVALFLVSCAPAATTTAPSPAGTTTGPATTTTAPPTTKPAAEVPRYGGVYTTVVLSDPGGFDPGATEGLTAGNTLRVHDDGLLLGDWIKGVVGTGETDWQYGNMGRSDILTGHLAESWEMPDSETIIFRIRKGVRYWNKAPANGREFTAEDAAWNVTRQWAKPGLFLTGTNPPSDYLISAKALDKYTLEIKAPAHVQGLHLLMDGERLHMMSPDAAKLWGSQSDWRNALGTGPFMLTDFVSGSSITYTRNPNYWMKDTVGPGKGQQLPYLEGIKELIIPDLSTRIAAFRTGKVDRLFVTWEDARDLIKNPRLNYIKTFQDTSIPTFRQDKPDLPFKDLRVRQALNLAVDQKAIVKSYYEGQAEVMGWPFYPVKAHEPFYTPLEQMPASVQELFTYNPEKAKKLLAEAGYPNGFKTEINCSAAGTAVDFLSIIREQLLKVGVDMEIKPLEAGVFTSLNRGRTHAQGIFKETKMYFVPWKMHELRKESLDNLSFYEHERTRAVYDIINLNLGKNDVVWMKAVKDVTPFMLEQCAMGIWVPIAHMYDIWWPWVKNYHGADDIGYFTPNKFVWHIWIDTELKKSMGY